MRSHRGGRERGARNCGWWEGDVAARGGCTEEDMSEIALRWDGTGCEDTRLEVPLEHAQGNGWLR